MTYYEEMSGYAEIPSAPGAVTIGWLDPPHDFSKGPTPTAFADGLLRLSRVLVHPARGWHVCGFCGASTKGPLAVRSGDQTLELGFAEIRVFGKGGVVYAAPNLVYHYVVAHSYRPPEPFIEAVLNDPKPFDPVYMEQLRKHGAPYWHYGQDGKIKIKPFDSQSQGAPGA